MKIALVHPRMDIPGGAERLVFWLAHGLNKRGLDVAIFTERFSHSFTNRDIRVETLKTGLLNKLINSKLMDKKSYAKQLSCLLKDFSTVISFNFPSYWWVAEAKGLSTNFPNTIWFCNEPLRRLYRDKTDRFLYRNFKNVTETFRSPDGSLEASVTGYNFHLKKEVQKRLLEDMNNLKRQERDRKIDKESVLSMDKVLAISDYTAQNLKLIFGIEPTVCYPGIPLRRNDSTDINASAAKENTILTIAWNSPKKNINNVLEAVKILSEEGSITGFKLKIIGYDTRLYDINKLIENLGITDMVEFIGYVDEKELFQYYRTAKAVVYIPIDEPFGLVAVEAMMCGTPVVVSNHGGPREIVQDGKTGIHVDPFDPFEVADALKRLLSDDKLINRMGQDGYNLVRENFTIDHFVERFLDDIIVS